MTDTKTSIPLQLTAVSRRYSPQISSSLGVHDSSNERHVGSWSCLSQIQRLIFSLNICLSCQRGLSPTFVNSSLVTVKGQSSSTKSTNFLGSSPKTEADRTNDSPVSFIVFQGTSSRTAERIAGRSEQHVGRGDAGRHGGGERDQEAGSGTTHQGRSGSEVTNTRGKTL